MVQESPVLAFLPAAMPRPIQATIDVPALLHILARCRAEAPDARLWAVV